MEKLVGLQERQKEVLEGVTAVLKVSDYKTQVKCPGHLWSFLSLHGDLQFIPGNSTLPGAGV